jgi:RNA polymerase sigma-70 factor, ECF subfamily
VLENRKMLRPNVLGSSELVLITYFSDSKRLPQLFTSNTSMSIISRTLEQLGHGRLSDEEVVNRVLGGDSGLFELLIRRHDQRVYRLARAITRNEADAEDIAQETYLQAFQHLGQFEGRAKFSTWLLKIALHESLARYRENSRFEDLDEIAESVAGHTDPRSSPEQMVARGEIGDVLKQAIDELPPTLRAVVMLREIEGMSTAEAAEVLEISEDNLNVRLHRAKAALREKLVDRAGEQGPHLFLFEAPRCDRLVQRVFQQIHQLVH